jgi:hypothetical protein
MKIKTLVICIVLLPLLLYAATVNDTDNWNFNGAVNINGGGNVMTNRVPIPLTYTSTNIYTDASLANTFRVTLTNNATLQLPTGALDGQTIRWWITQGIGSNTLNIASSVVYPTGTTNLSLSTATGSRDLLIGEYDGSTTNLHLTGLLLYPR